jgi:hypothetical protein
MTIERNIYRIILLAAIVYILFLQMCNRPAPCPGQQVKSITVDTGYIIDQYKSTWQKPKPVEVIRQGKALKPEVIYRDTGKVVVLPVDTAAIMQDYFAKVFYRDTLKTQYGTITLEDTISQNRIQARRWATNFTIPTITKTVTKTVAQRNQLYAGFSGLFGQTAIGAEINFTLKTKSDKQYEIGAGLLGLQPYARIGTKFKLSFK